MSQAVTSVASEQDSESEPTTIDTDIAATWTHGRTVDEWIQFLEMVGDDVALAFEGELCRAFVVIEDGSLQSYRKWAPGHVTGPEPTDRDAVRETLAQQLPRVEVRPSVRGQES